METLNELFVAKVVEFRGSTSNDVNNEHAVILICQAGVIPNRNTLSGTVAKMAGFEVGKTYLGQVRETGFDEIFGKDFTWLALQEVNSLQIVQLRKELGEAKIIPIPRPEVFNGSYIRKTNAVESIRNKRIKAGLYRSITNSDLSHKSADEVYDGTSVNNESLKDLEEQVDLLKKMQKPTEGPLNEDNLSGK